MSSYMFSEIQEQPRLVQETVVSNELTIDRIVASVKQISIYSAFLVARGNRLA